MALSFLCSMVLAFSSLPSLNTGIKHDTDRSGPTRTPICLRHLSSSTAYYRPNPVPVNGEKRSVKVEKLRNEFIEVLCSRRSAEVPLSIKPAKPPTNPQCQEAVSPQFREISYR
ncbi:hypothetical protein L484_006156 [Morus notabilis]|uniref:Uncharacterized protein n=1 Tax=Morus notabilis TaxID=981085 RepID=W9RZJ8_9ROSA|nr:hypothetical protein L484_006156 [Morus notabilis]